MGLAKSTVGYLVREHIKEPFTGPALVLGRQHVYTRPAEFERILADNGLQPKPLPEGMSYLTDMPSWEYGQNAGYMNDRALFWALAGIELHALDSSDYENAEIVCDLNNPIPAEYEGKFGVVLDGGTMEHVFDVRSTLSNINRLCRPGGRIIHISPGTNWIDHGFYHFSPGLFYDYYGVNGFEDMQCYVADQGLGDLTRCKWGWYKWNLNRNTPRVTSGHAMAVFFSARKTEASTYDKIPQQGEYGERQQFGLPKAARAWQHVVPPYVRAAARRYLWKSDRVGRY